MHTLIHVALGCADQGFVAISAIALNVATSGSILAQPDACSVMAMALCRGSIRALVAASGNHRSLARYCIGVLSVHRLNARAKGAGSEYPSR